MPNRAERRAQAKSKAAGECRRSMTRPVAVAVRE